MKIEFRLSTATVIAAALILAAVAEGARSKSMNEEAALELLQRTLKRDHVYEKRISLDCIPWHRRNDERSVRPRPYANRARESGRDHEFLQILTAATAVR